MADVMIPIIGGSLDGEEVPLDETVLMDGRIFDFRPSVLDADADPRDVDRYRLCYSGREWAYRLV